MKHDVLSLRWPVHPWSYRFVDATYNTTVVTHDPPDGSGASVFEPCEVEVRTLVYPLSVPDTRWYNPLRAEPPLFMTFAKTPATERGIVEFANRYGGLGVGVGEQVIPCLPEEEYSAPKPHAVRHGRIISRIPTERFELWTKQIEAMRIAVWLWELVRRDDKKELARHIRWRRLSTGRQQAVCSCTEPATDGGRPQHRSVRLAAFTDQDNPHGFSTRELSRPVWVFIGEQINEHLRGEVSPHLDWAPAEGLSRFSFAPTSLAGSLWLQFAMAVAGSADLRSCKECGSIFEVSLMASRADKQFCSTGCRVKAYRDRKSRARRLHESGKRPQQIAVEVGVDVAQVRKWIAKKRG
jgi:hypothetical protein